MRFLIRLIFILFVLLFIVMAFGWFYAASQVKEQLANAVNNSRGSDTSIDFDNVEVSGFPVSFNVTLTNLSVDSQSKGVFWQAPTHVAAKYSFFSPKTLMIEASGQHLISGTGTNANFPLIKVDLAAERIAATVGFDQKVKNVDLGISSLVAHTAGLGNTTMKNFKFQLNTPNADASVFTGSMDSFTPPEPFATMATLSGAEIGGSIKQGLPKSIKKRHISAWQKAGGEVVLDGFRANVLPMMIDGNGTIGLSDNLQLNASVTTYAQNFEEMLNKAIELGFLQADRLSYIQLGSVMFQRPSRLGQGNEMVLPLKVRDGDVAFGPFKLATLPRINWRN
ncbi:MAG: DUF2125 domain-containing protein [Alphaproteobacteria bacterium]